MGRVSGWLRFLRVLAVIQVVIIALPTLAAGFADGGQWWERLVLGVLQPASALLILVLVWQATPAVRLVRFTTAVLAAHVIANGAISVMILTDVIRGDWFLPLIFVPIPLVILTYCFHLRRS